jgi:hypothetical protein
VNTVSGVTFDFWQFWGCVHGMASTYWANLGLMLKAVLPLDQRGIGLDGLIGNTSELAKPHRGYPALHIQQPDSSRETASGQASDRWNGSSGPMQSIGETPVQKE